MVPANPDPLGQWPLKWRERLLMSALIT